MQRDRDTDIQHRPEHFLRPHPADTSTSLALAPQHAPRAATDYNRFDWGPPALEDKPLLDDDTLWIAPGVRMSLTGSARKSRPGVNLSEGDFKAASECDVGRLYDDMASLGGRCEEVSDTNTNDAAALSDMIVLTEELKAQIAKLQLEAAEHNEKLSVLQTEVSELKLARTIAPAEDSALQPLDGHALADAASTSSPRRGRLSQVLRSAFSRSPSRSNSPQKKIRIEFSATKESPAPFICPSPARSISPARSPSRRIEARLGPRILDNVTTFVDSQIQNLELRMTSMEASMEHWRRAAIPSDAVDGMCSSDLAMLSGLAVPDRLQLLADPSSESVWDPPSCSVTMSCRDEPLQPVSCPAEPASLVSSLSVNDCKPSPQRLQQGVISRTDNARDKRDKCATRKGFVLSRLFRRKKARLDSV